MSKQKLLQIKALRKYFTKKGGLFKRRSHPIKAVDNVSFHIDKGETLGIVGESGSGKSTLGRTIVRLYEPTTGEIIFKQKNIANLKNRDLLPYRKDMQMIFQDPYSSLNPRMKIGDLIEEPMSLDRRLSKQDRKDKVIYLMEKVGLSPDAIHKYPHEFSGGQRQRISIAQSLSSHPLFIVADEPVSALDVSIQSQILNLLMDLQEDYQLTYLFISHDLNVVKHISDRVLVMYLGKVVEMGTKKDIYDNPIHPYTKLLLHSIPTIGKRLKSGKTSFNSDFSDVTHPSKGCVFQSRCPFVQPNCLVEQPSLKDIGNNHQVACHLTNKRS